VLTPRVPAGSWLIPPTPEEAWFDAQPEAVRQQIAARADELYASAELTPEECVMQAVAERMSAASCSSG